MDMDFMLMGEDEILEQVDEYLLYCFYLGFNPEMRVRYKSPVRDPHNADDNASWSLFTNTSRLSREYAWKDSGTGEFGDIYKLVMIICGCKNRASAIARVKQDFFSDKGSEIARQGISAPKNVDPAHIKLKSRAYDHEDLQWWNKKTGADEEILKHFCTRRVQYYWMYDSQNTPSFCNDRVYSYRIGDHYQLYFPHRDRDRRFRNDFTDEHLLGYNQLRYQSDTLIITKSMKDIITQYVLGYESVSPRGEHTPIPERFMILFKSKFKRIVTLFDNDGKHRAWAYDCPSIELPILPTKEKDSSDYYDSFGGDYTKEVIDCLIENHPAMKEFAGIDLKQKMNRLQLEQLLEKVYLNRVIKIQHVGRKVIPLCGKIHRIAMDYDRQDEPLCIIMLDNTRYEFALGYFIQKALIQQQDGYTRTTNPGD
jgi:hypothetical protein